MALATRCPFCETVFRLDPHLLAPHDGRVRCGHCQEVFDAAHYQFERDETVMAALAATSPNYEQHPPPAPKSPVPDYGNDATSPWASSSNAEVAEGKKTALGIPLHPFIPETALAPQFEPEPSERQQDEDDAPPFVFPSDEARTPVQADREPSIRPNAPVDPSRDERLAAFAAAEAAARTHAESNSPFYREPSIQAETSVDRLHEERLSSFAAAEAAAKARAESASSFTPEPLVQSEAPVDLSHDERSASFAEVEAEIEAASRAHAESDRQVERETFARHAPVDPVHEEPSVAFAAAEAAARMRTESTFPGEGVAQSPWEAARRAQADERAQNQPFTAPRDDAPAAFKGENRTDPFIGRIDQDRVSDTRAEPFVGRAEPLSAPPLIEPAAPSDPWHADAEPRFAAPPTLDPTLPPPAPSAEPFPVTRETRPAARSGAAWKVIGSIVALLLLVTLIAQLAWWQRETVMVYWPHSQELFAQACEQVGCTVAPPRDIDALQIENSGLRQVDGSHKLELKLALRNRFDVAIAYPALELTLLDDKNNVAIRRVLWPKEYARPGSVLTTGIPARNTMPVIVRLDTGDAVAANYRVQIFYP